MSKRTTPLRCPSCQSELRVVKLECPSCAAEVNGDFDPCPACSLQPDARKVFDLFLESRGNLKQVQRALKVSYPTARQRVDTMFRQLEGRPEPKQPAEILQQLRNGEIDVDEAERLLRESR